MKIGVVAVAGVLLCGGCFQTKRVPPEALVENKSANTVVAVDYRACDDEGAWLPLHTDEIPRGQGARLDLPVECADLRARRADGRVVGTQTGIKKRFTLHWVIY